MNKKVFIFFLILTSNVFAENVPDWLLNTDKYCSKNEYCATGEGNTLNSAKTDARNNIQKIFETKVSSKYSNTLENDNDKVSENTFNEVSDETNGILNGVNITKSYNQGNKYYVLAVLDKTIVIKNIENDVKQIDEKMEILMKEDNYGSSLKLENLYKEREQLNKKYLFLTGNELKENVSYRQMLKNKNTKKNSSPSYFIKVDEPYDSLYSVIKEILVKNDLKVINQPTGGLIKNVKADLKMTKDYINVKGFERYKINFNVDISKNGKSSGFIKLEFLETGRNKEQIYGKSIERIREYIEKNFDEFIN